MPHLSMKGDRSCVPSEERKYILTYSTIDIERISYDGLGEWRIEISKEEH